MKTVHILTVCSFVVVFMCKNASTCRAGRSDNSMTTVGDGQNEIHPRTTERHKLDATL